MHSAPPFEDWGLHWATSARDVPQGQLLAGFLVDLVADTSRTREANTVCFPLAPAAHALGVEPARITAVLRSLAKARLLTWRMGGAVAPEITVTLFLSSSDRAAVEERNGVRTHSHGSESARPVRPDESMRAAV
jgi:hypothetical protein